MHQLKTNGRKLDLPRSMYPRLEGNVSLQMFPSYGLILCEDPPKMERVSKDTVEILAYCNGLRTFDDILETHINSEKRGNDIEICLSILALAKIIREGMIILDRNPNNAEPTITRSSIYCPTSIQVELTTSCNLRCSYCYRSCDSKKTNDKLTTARLLEILSNLSDNGMRCIELTGGEPLMHPDFTQIVRFCGERFDTIGLLTNGTLITESIIDELLPIKNKIVISVSLDSHIPEVHDARRGLNGAFIKTTNAISMLSKHKFLTRISMAVDEDNWKDVESCLLLARRLGATMFAYGPILPFGGAKRNFRLWNYDAKDVLQTMQLLSRKYKGFLHLLHQDQILDMQQSGGCGAGHRVYAMDPKGFVRPCTMFEENQGILGSLKKQTPADVFSSELTASFASIEPPNLDVCESCKWALFCQHCSLRGFMASQWVGDEKCMWLNQPKVRQWSSLLRNNTLDNNLDILIKTNENLVK